MSDRERQLQALGVRVERTLRREAEGNGRTLREHATNARIARHIDDVLSNGEWDGPVSARFRGDAARLVRETVRL